MGWEILTLPCLIPQLIAPDWGKMGGGVLSKIKIKMRYIIHHDSDNSPSDK